jgi:tetratricopeptide (TPR) repeat protein
LPSLQGFALLCFCSIASTTGIVLSAHAQTEARPLDNLEQGKAAYAAGEYSDAVRLLLSTLNDNSSREAYYYLGLSYYNLGLYALTIDAFEVALKAYGKEVPVDLLFSLGLSHYYANALEPAQEYLNQVLNDPRTSPEMRALAEEQLLLTLRDQSSAYQDALTAYQAGEFETAKSLFEEALRIMPNSPELYYYLGVSAYQLLDFALAKQSLEQVVSLAPEGEFASSARQTLAVVDKLAQNIPLKPFTGSLTLGSFGDSNVNYGGAPNNAVSNPLQSSATAPFGDGGSSANLDLNYRFNEVLSARYNYFLNLYWGLNDANSADRLLSSADYNLQQHSFTVSQRYSLTDWVEMNIDSRGGIQFLAGDPFFGEISVRPTFTFYETERLISRAYVDLTTEQFTRFAERDNFNYAMALEQYIYLWNSRTWLRFNYRFLHVLARDNIQSTQQENNGQIIQVDFLTASSRSQNQIGMGFAFPLGPIDIEMGSNFDFLLYHNPDIYKASRIAINPLTGLPLPPEALPGLSVEKLREDTRLVFYTNAEWKFDDNWSLVGRYNRTTNVSNISAQEIRTLTSRSYLKDVAEILLRYRF